MRDVEDAKKIDAGMLLACMDYWTNLRKLSIACKEGKRLVVIGSSFISMELVVAVSSRKLASIDVVGQESVPFEAVLGKEVGSGLMKVPTSRSPGCSLL